MILVCLCPNAMWIKICLEGLKTENISKKLENSKIDLKFSIESRLTYTIEKVV